MTLTSSTADLVDVLTPQVERLFERHLADDQVVDAARADPVGAGRRVDATATPGIAATLDAAVRRAQRARRQSPHRGQPPVLLRDHQPDVRERRVARVGAALDRRGDAARDRDPRLHHGHALGRSGRARERARMHQVCGGQVPQPESAVDTLAYVALQELATRISHRNTGNLLDDEAGYKVMARVAADENLHYLFYRDLVSAALEIDPSGTDVRDRAPGAHVRDARRRHPRLRRAHASRSPRPASTTSCCTTTRCSCRSCCGTGASRRSRVSAPKRSSRASGSCTTSPHRAHRPAPRRPARRRCRRPRVVALDSARRCNMARVKAIEVRGLRKAYAGVEAVRDLELQRRRGRSRRGARVRTARARPRPSRSSRGTATATRARSVCSVSIPRPAAPSSGRASASCCRRAGSIRS